MEKEFISLRSTIQKKIDGIVKRNPRISLRKISQDIGVPQATLSDYLRGKVAISIDNSERLLKWLNLSPDVENYLNLTTLFELARDDKNRDRIRKSILGYKNGRYFLESREIDLFLSRVEIRNRTIYSQTRISPTEVGLRTRTLFLLNDKETGRPVESFYELFVDHQNPSIAGGYFLKNEDGTFRVYLCDKYQGGHRGVIHDSKNQQVKVSFDKFGYPHVHSSQAVILRDDKEAAVLDFIFSKDLFVSEGYKFLKNKPEEKTHVRYVFDRIFPKN